ncbi:MAG: FAD:protein FMN transferase [Clostridium sp.]|nr:FAD:protein FMN transferase [Clostridium sp.]
MKPNTHMRLPIFAILCAILLSCSAPEFRYAKGATWGTTYSIIYKSPRSLDDSIIAVMRRVDLSLSPFEKNSQVSMLNANLPVVADPMLRDVLALSKEVCSISGGAFDPTVAPLVNLWGFGYRPADAPRPSPQDIDSALRHVGIMDCGINPDGSVYKKSPSTEFNFSAIAKGYGVDAIAAMLRRNGCSDFMVEVGGEIALAGKSPRGEDWRIQIDAPVPDSLSLRHERLTVLQLTDKCVATSGNYRNFKTIGDTVVGHTISPVTGRPIASDILSATVIAPSAALADALATASMAMPLPDARQMLASLPSIQAILVTPDSIIPLNNPPQSPQSR